MKPGFSKRRNARIFLFQYIFSNLYEQSSFEQIKEHFWFKEQEIDEEQVEKYIDLYETNSNFISASVESITNANNVSLAIIKVGLVLKIAKEDKQLIISECLKLSDFFLTNSSFVNAILEKILV